MRVSVRLADDSILELEPNFGTQPHQVAEAIWAAKNLFPEAIEVILYVPLRQEIKQFIGNLEVKGLAS